MQLHEPRHTFFVLPKIMCQTAVCTPLDLLLQVWQPYTNCMASNATTNGFVEGRRPFASLLLDMQLHDPQHDYNWASRGLSANCNGL